MEIHVNGLPVAKIDDFIRSVAISGDEGAITRFDAAPTSRIINIETEHRVEANAPRLDEVEFLHYLDALDKGLLSGDGDPDGTPLNQQATERITESEYPTAEERQKEIEEIEAREAEESDNSSDNPRVQNEHNEVNVGESREGDIENRTNLGGDDKDAPKMDFGVGANRDGSGEMK